MNDIEQVIEQEFSKFIKKHAIKAQPKYTLVKILGDKSFNKLKELAKLHRIPKYSTLDKASLIFALCNTLVEKGRLEDFLFMSDDESLKELVALSKVIELKSTAITCFKLDFFRSLGIVELYYYEDKFISVMSTEIKQVIEKIYTPNFIKKKKRDSLILSYARSCISLYGFISQDEFVEIFNTQNKTPTNIDEIFSVLINHITPGSDFCFWDEYIVSSCFEDDDFKDVAYLIKATESKPRYIPDKSEFLKYADGSYYEETIYTKKLESHLRTICKDEYVAEDLADEICFLAATEADINDIMAPVNEAGITFTGTSDVQVFVDIIMNLKNNTRIWSNKGYTPIELHHFYYKNSVPASVQKTGRNEPCPCGSGKKFKKCCGK